MIRGGILTVSDKGSRGDRQDDSSRKIRECLASFNIRWENYEIVPDEKEAILSKLKAWSDDEDLDLLLTNGGTGLSPRDVTPEATMAVIDKVIPGIPEAMRSEGLRKTPMSMLSRAVAGTRGKTLIINLPGSPRAVEECLEAISAALPHAIETLRGRAEDCATLRKG